jgi:tetraacyldisaccharide 4'-kinase
MIRVKSATNPFFWPVGADRARSGQVAIEEFSADCLVLDDGYQHLRLHRDLNLLCLDAVREAPAFLDRIERLLPAGRLREPLAAMKRAGVIFLTKYNFADPETADRLRRDVERRLPGTPVVPVRYELAIVDPLAGNSVVDVSGQSVVALSGLASPWTFEEGLRRKGAQVAPLRFPDHHFFSERDRREALDRAAACGARVIVTEKDYQRLPKDFPCWVARLEWIPEQEKDRAWTEKIDSVIS